MKEASKEILKLRGGVIIIGSLFWEKTEIREKWINDNLIEKQKQFVKVPIRYGRISSTRNCTFTMVFSTECTAADKIGTGIFVPFAINPVSFSELLGQVKNLINAEFNKIKNLKSPNWDWGSVGIITNPSILKEDSPNFKAANLFLSEWAKKFPDDFNTDDYIVGKEESIISSEGTLKIDWPFVDNYIDFAIATVVKPAIPQYPNEKNIADRMIVNEYNTYFLQNLNSGIYTFQDEKIKEFLSSNTL